MTLLFGIVYLEGMDGIGRVGVFGLLVIGLAGSLGWGKREGGCPPRLQGGWGEPLSLK